MLYKDNEHNIHLSKVEFYGLRVQILMYYTKMPSCSYLHTLIVILPGYLHGDILQQDISVEIPEEAVITGYLQWR